MDDTKEDSKYPPDYGLNQGYGSLQNPKVLVHNVPYTQSQIVGKYVEEDDDEVEEDDEEQEQEQDQEQEQEQEQEETHVGDDEMNGSTQQNGNDDDHNEDNDNQFDDDDDDDDDDDHSGRMDSVNLQRHPKKRKLKSLLSSYEFAPRVPPPPVAQKSSFGGRNTLTDWSEDETFVLLEAWGERFLQCGRKSLRSEEWQEVANRVSQESKIERTDSQCRNRLDTLKKKYKKEKANLMGSRGVNTKWVYFKKMDMLLSSSSSSSTHQQAGRGDSGENVFLNPSANGVDEMRDSGGNSDSDDSDLVPPKKLKPKAFTSSGGGSFRLLADSINKFSEIYEKIENSKIQQMIELEKMRMDFHRDLELQKRQILDRAQAEITKVRQGDYEENDVSG